MLVICTHETYNHSLNIILTMANTYKYIPQNMNNIIYLIILNLC